MNFHCIRIVSRRLFCRAVSCLEACSMLILEVQNVMSKLKSSGSKVFVSFTGVVLFCSSPPPAIPQIYVSAFSPDVFSIAAPYDLIVNYFNFDVGRNQLMWSQTTPTHYALIFACGELSQHVHIYTFVRCRSLPQSVLRDPISARPSESERLSHRLVGPPSQSMYIMADLRKMDR